VPVVGITGGISTGKTTFCATLRELTQAPFFNADDAARQLVDRDEEVRQLLRSEFGQDIYSPSGDLNRAALRAIVFADATKKRALEQILHPRIRDQWSTASASRRNTTELFLADIPLLYETAGEKLCDFVVVVACSAAMQLERLIARTGMGRSVAETMIASQMPLSAKIARADHVVWNNGPPAGLLEQARLLVSLWQKQNG
jgi:dephospho-CoA kinase